MDEPVVNIEETYSTGRRSFLTGWIVTRWDGRNETQTVIPVHKGEPDVTVDDDARNDWQSHHAAVRNAIGWACDVWGIMGKTDWPFSGGDLGTVLVRIGSETATTFFRFEFYVDGGMFFNFLDRTPHRYVIGPYLLHPATLTAKRKTAILSASRDERLWEMVFVHPEQEWRFRWNVFVDFLRDGEWGDD
jgi:hypothetical protein